VIEYRQTKLTFYVSASDEESAKEIASDRGWGEADNESSEFQESEILLIEEGDEQQ
jgi:hypothetical protein